MKRLLVKQMLSRNNIKDNNLNSPLERGMQGGLVIHKNRTAILYVMAVLFL
jgi:hypothetical protein